MNTFRRANSGYFMRKSGAPPKSASRLHSVMIAAKEIRKAHAAGKLTAEEAAEKLAKLYNVNRPKVHRKGNSLLSA